MDWFLYDRELSVVKELTHFSPMPPFDDPKKHQENQRFSDVFWGDKKETFGRNVLRVIVIMCYRTQQFDI